MIILDTNVLSELMRPEGSPAVLAWTNAQPDETLFVTAISLSENLAGVAILPEGRRKTESFAIVRRIYSDLFGDRLLGFDSRAAEEFATLFAERRRAGRPIKRSDGEIAAIARANRMAVATRDADFIDTGPAVINPWTFSP